jgi:hypothetical protein
MLLFVRITLSCGSLNCCKESLRSIDVTFKGKMFEPIECREALWRLATKNGCQYLRPQRYPYIRM